MVLGVEAVGGAQLRGDVELGRVRVDGEDAAGLAQLGSLWGKGQRGRGEQRRRGRGGRQQAVQGNGPPWLLTGTSAQVLYFYSCSGEGVIDCLCCSGQLAYLDDGQPDGAQAEDGDGRALLHLEQQQGSQGHMRARGSKGAEGVW